MGSEEGKGRLSRDLICEATLGVIDRVGLDMVTMRTVAAALGVKASSLYHHFGSKDELMTEVAEFLYRRLGPAPSGDDWSDQVRQTFIHLRRFIEAHPKAAPLLLRDLAHSQVARNETEALFSLVSGAGVDLRLAANLLANLVALLIGHTLLSVWMQEEGSALAAGGAGNGDLLEIWSRRLFPGRAAGLDTSAEAEPPSELAFASGIDALMRGFTSARL